MIATDYDAADGLTMQQGQLITDTPGDANHNGFDEQTGVFVVRPEADLVRLWIGGDKRAHYRPTFVVPGTQGSDAWVYCDNQIIEPIARTIQGNVLFQIPKTVGTSTLVEVVLRRR